MDPTNKLVKDLVAMEACYVNTGHPDFLNGHRAMAIVNERHQASKPVQVDPKTGKPLPASAAPPRSASPSIDGGNGGGGESGGFFGSFFASKNKKKMAAMDAPPPTLKASGTLSEKETQEVEVIKLLITSYYNIVRRTMIDMVPKAIMLNLVEHTKDEMQRELLEQMYRQTELDDLLKESDYTVRRRKECQQMVESLGRASEIWLCNLINSGPPGLSNGHEGKWISDGVEKFGRYFRRKGWITDAQEAEAEAEVEGNGKGKLRKAVSNMGGKWWGRGEGGVRLVVEVATAYAITKALLPLRLVVSVWATPWFARWSVLPVTRYFKRGSGSRAKASPAAGTGAVGGGVLPKDVGGKG
ncbi:hypothetical protein D0864_13587 [Hortaea werneckii]|uniref:GED domain-containing protein n=1 Tax=Hortaea werneckii TaxID=91943 RepID=A0A3M7CZ17_HORWE|nr:hypothetical protein D0864_13587 [Hortaea werneckii]